VTHARKGAIRQANEAKILRAAERVFARAGFAGAAISEIARLAKMPKPNLHYYFKHKRALYRAVLNNILHLWLSETDSIHADAEPREAIEQYVRAKMRFSWNYPDASRVFANEVIHGAPEIGRYLRTDMRELIDRKSEMIERWIAEGRMAPIAPRHLFFMIWATTQTYADFSAQVEAVLGARRISTQERALAEEQVVSMILRACGFYYLPLERNATSTQPGDSSAGDHKRRRKAAPDTKSTPSLLDN
jgi:TetR/AcrR family transcriptional regulator